MFPGSGTNKAGSIRQGKRRHKTFVPGSKMAPTVATLVVIRDTRAGVQVACMSAACSRTGTYRVTAAWWPRDTAHALRSCVEGVRVRTMLVTCLSISDFAVPETGRGSADPDASPRRIWLRVGNMAAVGRFGSPAAGLQPPGLAAGDVRLLRRGVRFDGRFLYRSGQAGEPRNGRVHTTGEQRGAAEPSLHGARCR